MNLNRCLLGDCRDGMRTMIAEGVRVNCIVTSPPYWGLRDYKVAGQLGLEPLHDCLGWATGSSCAECYVCRMREVFTLALEILADDGTLWLNLGDSYTAAGGTGHQGSGQRRHRAHTQRNLLGNSSRAAGLPPKNLVGIPWRVALALQADGWYLRQDIVWNKPNPMPESVRDRCTKAHEYLFLFSRSERYYFDAAAIAEPLADSSIARLSQPMLEQQVGSDRVPGKTNGPMKDGAERGCPADTGSNVCGSVPWEGSSRNKRSVWTVATTPFKDAHFAVMPESLAEPCILAGTRPGDIVFDPFLGSGTTAAVAQRLGRKWLGCDLNPEYLQMQHERTRQPGMELSA